MCSESNNDSYGRKGKLRKEGVRCETKNITKKHYSEFYTKSKTHTQKINKNITHKKHSNKDQKKLTYTLIIAKDKG